MSAQSTIPADVRESLQPSLVAALSLLDWPTAVVADGETVAAQNVLWTKVLRQTEDSGTSVQLSSALKGFTPIEPLIAALRSKAANLGNIRMRFRGSGWVGAWEHRDVFLRWRQIDPLPDGRTLAIVMVQDAEEVERPGQVIAAQQLRINRLLVRQSLIEEAERRRLGRALHDVVAQDLGQLRRTLSDQKVRFTDVGPFLAGLDRVIEEVRTLSFELSPPILEDLGLCPALEWLADHVSKRYGTNVSVTADASEPTLAASTRTIVFRVVRELLVNAAKHAPDAEVRVSCGVVGSDARVVVRDNGPGFDPADTDRFPGGSHHFGLLSVEQQIRSIGGSFDLVSILGSGTTISITVPLEPKEESPDV